MGISTSRTTWAVVRAYLLLPHAIPVIVVLLATLAFALVATDGNPGGGPLASLLIAMLGAQLAIGATNELVDVELDRISKSHKPIPAGFVSERGAVTVVVIGLMLMVLGSLRFSLLAGVLCALGAGIGIAYSVWFKRTVWSWLPYVLGIPLLPIWVWVALTSPPAAIFLLFPIAVPALVAVHVAQSIPDLNGDRDAGIQNLTVWMGARRARLTCWGLVGISTFLAVLLSSFLTANPTWCWLAGAVSLGLVGINVHVWQQDRELGENTCFPLTAAAVVVLGVGWAASSLP